MSVAGTDFTSRATSLALRRCMRCWRTRKSGRPRSLRAITSPSTIRSRSPQRRCAELGPGGGHVVVVAAGHPGDAVADVDEDADAVPLHLVQPLRTGRHAVGLAGEHRAHAGQSGIPAHPHWRETSV